MADAENSTPNSRLISREPADFFYLTRLEQWYVGLNLARRRHGEESYPKGLWLNAKADTGRVFVVRGKFVTCPERRIPALIEYARGKARQKCDQETDRYGRSGWFQPFLSQS